ncbi:ABC transporter ATP-binding protein, partial [Bacillus wiedmannii]
KTVLLHEKEGVLAKDLAHGEKRKLELAMLLALKTDVLLLDEPTAGISVEEVPAILQVIENIKKHPESTIVLIEHKMDMV